MIQPTIVSWVLIVFGIVTTFPLFYAQVFMILAPNGRKTKGWLIEKGEGWRDGTHFSASLGAAWGDCYLSGPIFLNLLFTTCGRNYFLNQKQISLESLNQFVGYGYKIGLIIKYKWFLLFNNAYV